MASLNVRISSSKSAVYILLSILQSMADSGWQRFFVQISTCCNIMRVMLINIESFPASLLNKIKSFGTLYVFFPDQNDPKSITQGSQKLNSDFATQSPQTLKNPSQNPKRRQKWGRTSKILIICIILQSLNCSCHMLIHVYNFRLCLQLSLLVQEKKLI